MNKQMKELKPFDPGTYESIDLDRLVIHTSVMLEHLGVELSIENIIVGAFKLFPKKFSLIGYSEFPDATRVEKALWRCRGNKRKWIGGKTPHGYLTTERSKIISAQVEAQLSNPLLRKKKVASRMRRKESILKEIINSSAYSKYLSGKIDSISEGEFCFLLQGTLDSTKDILKENFSSLKRFAEELNRKDVLIFLSLLERHFSKFLNKK